MRGSFSLHGVQTIEIDSRMTFTEGAGRYQALRLTMIDSTGQEFTFHLFPEGHDVIDLPTGRFEIHPEGEPAPTTCPECGEVSVDFLVCPRCGANL